MDDVESREMGRCLAILGDRLGIIMVDGDLRVSYANRTAEQLLGVSLGSLSGKYVKDLPLNIRAAILLEFKQVVSDQAPAMVEKMYGLDMRLKFNLYPADDGVVIIVDDISERWVETESMRMALLTINSLPDIVFMVRKNGRIINANDFACDLTAYSKNELNGMMIHQVLPGLDIQGSEWEGAEPNRVVEAELLRAGGGSIPVEVKVNRRKMYGSIMYLVIARDITERKRAREEVEDAKSRAELYLDLMSHDINNMNQSALGFLEIALEKLVSNRRLGLEDEPLIRTPLQAVESSSKLIENVRKIQLLSSEGVKTIPVDLHDLMDEIKSTYHRTIDKGVTVRIQDIPHYKVSGNELLRDVFINIIDNAIKHSMPDVLLTIDVNVKSVNQDGRTYYVCAIEDNGPGIPDELKPKLFRRFQRGGTKASGKGLGLYLVRTLVENLYGKVHVEDRVPGDHTKGAKFVVTLPAINE